MRTVVLPEKPVRIFVMGRNEWRDEESWPLERAVDQRWYLRADGGLNSDGPDSAEASSEFRYDPADRHWRAQKGAFVRDERMCPH
jgi:predicted acyl esterase